MHPLSTTNPGNMIIFKTIAPLREFLDRNRNHGQSIGFVPTMGALHEGHISLIRQSRSENSLTVCSIFVNPTQFNNPDDFAKYPQTVERDIDLLEAAGCDILFLPRQATIYPADYVAPHYELGYIESLWEGAHRPGHFQGVCQVVDRLLDITLPTHLYLGRKDYQQCMVIARLIELRQLPVILRIAETVRESDGLAMSSRNMRLGPEERQTATNIYQVLRFLKENLRAGETAPVLREGKSMLESKGFVVDYVAIANARSLEPVARWDGREPIVALIAAHLHAVRLIDNMILHEA